MLYHTKFLFDWYILSTFLGEKPWKNYSFDLIFVLLVAPLSILPLANQSEGEIWHE